MLRVVCALVVSLGWSMLAQAADLTPVETRWLKGAWPVIAHAQKTELPLDIVVQPQPAPGLPPLALAFVGGRCKLVLSMRGNDEAQATLDRIEPALLQPAIELMAAHELGHCRRWLDGAWKGLPAGFSAAVPASLKPELREAWIEMAAVRREEGYGDLVGLAWTRRHHPDLYARLHGWLAGERSRDRDGSHHDTTAWLQLASDGAVFDGLPIFDAAASVWITGLGARD